MRKSYSKNWNSGISNFTTEKNGRIKVILQKKRKNVSDNLSNNNKEKNLDLQLPCFPLQTYIMVVCLSQNISYISLLMQLKNIKALVLRSVVSVAVLAPAAAAELACEMVR